MKINLLPKMNIFDENKLVDIIFNSGNSFKTALITRYRGCYVYGSKCSTKIYSWQKSIYNFSGFSKSVPLLLCLETDINGQIIDFKIDERSEGSQGNKCRFSEIETCLLEKIRDIYIGDLFEIIKSSSDTDCLHMYEMLTAGASFYNYLIDNKNNTGLDQELLLITPDNNGLLIENTHSINDILAKTTVSLINNNLPLLNEKSIPEILDCSANVVINSQEIIKESFKCDTFESVYFKLNRLFVKTYNFEKNYFGLDRTSRFSNYPALTSLTLMALSYVNMHNKINRAIEMKKIIKYLQTEYGKVPCNGYKK